MNGWMGLILRVDLSQEEIVKESLPEEIALKFAGGRGLNSKFLYDELKPGVDPLGPANKIVIGTGPCNGTLVPGSTRFTVSFKSPLTGFLGDSNSGGTLGVALKYAGYDMLIIQGIAKRPSYLWIDDDKVELRNAEHLWGKTTGETRRAIESEIGDPGISVISIGPAGEKLVKMACLIGDLGRAAGRAGGGAVFGAKNLKAIAVRGSKGVRVANPRLLEEAWQEMYRAWHDDPDYYDDFTRIGTPGLMIPYNRDGILPTKNYLQGTYEDVELVSGQNMADWYFFKPKACFSCPVPCQHHYVIDRGPYAGEYGEGMELGQIEHFSSRLMINDLAFVAKASIVCNEYGLDVMEVAQLIGYVMEGFEKGILTSEDTGGLRIEWGNKDAALRLIDMVASRKGIGDLFAQGIKIASEKIGKGSEAFIQVIKGLTVPTRDPRGAKGWGLAYAVASRGADHCRTSIVSEGLTAIRLKLGFDPVKGEVQGEPGNFLDPLIEEGKGGVVKWYEDVRGFQNCMEMCLFISNKNQIGLAETLCKFYNAVVGSNLSKADCLRIGERIINLERAFNIREGLSRKDDTLPKRFLEEPLPDGPAKGHIVNNLDAMLDEYYEDRGWDKETGFPTREKLDELGLKEVADDLGRMNRLAK